MKNNKVLFGTIAGVALLVGGVFIDSYHQKSKKDTEQDRLQILNLDPNQVEEIHFVNKDEEVTLKRTVDGWQMLEPVKDQADNEWIADFLVAVSEDRAHEVAIDGDETGIPVSWKTFGLEAPLATYEWVDSLGKKNSVAISAERNFEAKHFLRKNDENRVLIGSSAWFDRAQRGSMDFRDRRFLRRRIASVTEVRVRNRHGEFHLKQDGADWQLYKPGSEQKKVLPSGKVIEQNKVREFLKGIADGRARYFEVEGTDVKKAPLKKYGLDRPRASLTLKLADELWQAEIGQNEQFQVFAKVSNPDFIMLMESGAIDDVLRFTENDFIQDSSKK